MGDHEGPWPRSVARIALAGCAGLPSGVSCSCYVEIVDLNRSLGQNLSRPKEQILLFGQLLNRGQVVPGPEAP